MLIGALITHHADTLDSGEQDGACLPDVVIEFCAVRHNVFTHVADIDIVGILQDAYLLRSDVTQYAHSKSRTWEWMTVDEMVRHSERTSYTAYLILEEPFQGFAE